MGGRGTRVLMPYVHVFKDRHGKIRHYYRRGGARAALPGHPGSPEFMAAYTKAAAGAEKPIRGAKGSFDHLIALYESSVEFKRLKPSTAGVYRNILAKFAAEHGHRLVGQLRRENIDAMLARMADKPGAANSFLKRFKTLMAFAIQHGIVRTDPTYKVKAFKAGEIHTWDEGQIAQFEVFWPVGTKERLAFALHLFTGQRRSDVHRMTWSHITGDAIRVKQQKTGSQLMVPLHPSLQAILDATERKHLVIISTEYGKAFSVAGYGSWINGAIHEAGLPPECVAHGLRKAAARRLAEAGCSANEIASITGHRTLSEVERYTRAADQVRLSKAAIVKQSANNQPAPVGKLVGKPSKED